ncbi:hypothetical protein LSAT2_002453, partial [Lamellibrachia satsuma]
MKVAIFCAALVCLLQVALIVARTKCGLIVYPGCDPVTNTTEASAEVDSSESNDGSSNDDDSSSGRGAEVEVNRRVGKAVDLGKTRVGNRTEANLKEESLKGAVRMGTAVQPGAE